MRYVENSLIMIFWNWHKITQDISKVNQHTRLQDGGLKIMLKFKSKKIEYKYIKPFEHAIKDHRKQL